MNKKSPASGTSGQGAKTSRRVAVITGIALLIGLALLAGFGHRVPRPDLALASAPIRTDPPPPLEEINFPARNPFLAKGANPLPHGDPAQLDASPIPGPRGTTRALRSDEITYRFLGPGYFGLYTSSLYRDQKRVLWANGVNGVYKLDFDSYGILAHLPTPEAEKYTQEWAEKISARLDRHNGARALPTAMKALLPLKSLSGIYAVVGTNGWFYIARKDGSVIAYGDAEDGNRASAIIEKARFTLPALEAGPSVGMNMTYDGWIVFPTENGYLIAVSSDLTRYRSVRLRYADTEEISSHGVGYGWVRNSIAIDEAGGIYVASRNHMHKVVWTGDQLSIDPQDGAWSAAYRNSTGEGTGATPSLMGFGDDEDKFVVLTDGDIRMNLVLMWRDAIPEHWEQLPDTPSRRIAGQAPVTMGALDVKKIQTEQTVVTAGYGAFVVNNTPRNVPFFMPKEGVGRGVVIGPLGSNPKYQPFGVQKFEWNPERQRLEEAWANEKISSPNGVPWVSTGSGQIYLIGARQNKWTLEAIDWLTGMSSFHYIIGGQTYNSGFSGPFIDTEGRISVGTQFGRLRLEPVQ